MARQGLSWNTLFSIVGDELLTNAMTPERNWLSQELPVNRSCLIIGDALFPPIAAPKPPLPC
jgi:hypothetical protein